MKEYTDLEIDELVAEVREAFQQQTELAKSEVLAKNSNEDLEKDDQVAPPDEQPAEAPPAEAATPDAQPTDAPAEEAPAEAPAEESSDSSDSSSSSSSSSSDSSSDSSSGSESEESLESAYGQLSDDDLKAHYDALKAVIMSRMGGDEGAGDAAPEPAPEAAPPVDAPPEAAGPAPALKSEKEFTDKLSKAESEINDLKTQLEKVTTLFENMLTKPQRKAVTSIAELNVITKSEAANAKPAYKTLTKSEITNKLSQKTLTPDLSKSDRDLINGYYLGSVKAADIEHLLK